jgi:hypothetical protein
MDESIEGGAKKNIAESENLYAIICIRKLLYCKMYL